MLLHGWPHTCELWRPVGETLARNGCGNLKPLERPAELAAAIDGFMDR